MQATYRAGAIFIRPPDFAAVQAAPVAADVLASRDRWRALAQENTSIVYFSIYWRDNSENKLVGQIFLHDYHHTQQEALIGYHLFTPHLQGQGIGTTALRLLLEYVLTETTIRHLTIITDQKNRASQRVAEKCGFVYAGPAREGLPLICYSWQRAP